MECLVSSRLYCSLSDIAFTGDAQNFEIFRVQVPVSTLVFSGRLRLGLGHLKLLPKTSSKSS